MKLRLFIFSLVLPSLFFSFLHAQELDVPMELQLRLFAKVLSFDRNLNERFKENINVAVLYQEKLRQSVLAKEQTKAFFDHNSWSEWDSTQATIHYIDVSDSGDVEEKLQANNIKIVLLLPVRNYDVARLAAVCRSIGATSLTPAPDYLKMGLSLSITLKSNKPSILLNLSAAKAEGADFSANLLNIATIVE